MRNPSRGSAGRQALVLAGGLAAWGLLAWIYVRRATPVFDTQPSTALAELPARSQFVEARLADSTHDRTVAFVPGRALLTPGGRALLDQLVPLILADSTASVSVDGRADAGGTSVPHGPLSQARARAVASYLVDHGIPASRLISRDSTWWMTTGDSTTDRQHSRRTEFRVHPGDS